MSVPATCAYEDCPRGRFAAGSDEFCSDWCELQVRSSVSTEVMHSPMQWDAREAKSTRMTSMKPGDLAEKMVFGRLTIRSLTRGQDRNLRAHCECSCGGETVVQAGDLIRGRIQSCGCLLREQHAKMRARDDELLAQRPELRTAMRPSKRVPARLADATLVETVEPHDTPSYNEYMSSEKWRRRSAILRRRAGKCRLCSSTESLQVHHNSYESFGDEDDNDLVVLCARCHGVFHDLLAVNSDCPL